MQQIIAFSLVGAAALLMVRKIYRSYLADPLSAILLKRGNVKLAMKVRQQAEKSGCGSCENSPQRKV
jgi:hypothetical protein